MHADVATWVLPSLAGVWRSHDARRPVPWIEAHLRMLSKARARRPESSRGVRDDRRGAETNERAREWGGVAEESPAPSRHLLRRPALTQSLEMKRELPNSTQKTWQSDWLTLLDQYAVGDIARAGLHMARRPFTARHV